MGGVIIGILVVTIVSIIAGQQKFDGIVDVPPSIAPVFLQMDLAGAIHVGLVTVIFAFLFVDLFDNTGTLIALAHRGGFMRPDGTVPRLNRALMSDSAAAMIGAAVGTSTTTSYIESASGIDAGGRTGLTALTVAVLFLLALFVAPLAGSIPPYATAPALLYVACLMTRGLVEVEWDDITEAAPAVITAIAMPFTFSIAEGIAFGFIAYVVDQAGRRQVQRHSSGCRNSRCAVRDQVHGHRIANSHIRRGARTFVCRRTTGPHNNRSVNPDGPKEMVLASRRGPCTQPKPWALA